MRLRRRIQEPPDPALHASRRLLGAVLPIIRLHPRISSMIDYRSLDRELRTVALVGAFMEAWSCLEGALNDAIASGSGLTTIQEYIFTRNISFTYKVCILSSLISVSALTASQKSYYSNILTDINTKLYWRRNVVAHDMFIASDNTDGVAFLTVKARRKVEYPVVDWSVDEFAGTIAITHKYWLQLCDLERIFRNLKPISDEIDEENRLKILELGWPTEGKVLPEPPHHLSPQHPTDSTLGTNPTIQETEIETLPVQQE